MLVLVYHIAQDMVELNEVCQSNPGCLLSGCDCHYEWEKSNLFDCDWLAYEEDLTIYCSHFSFNPPRARKVGAGTNWGISYPVKFNNPSSAIVIIQVDIHNRKLVFSNEKNNLSIRLKPPSFHVFIFLPASWGIFYELQSECFSNNQLPSSLL